MEYTLGSFRVSNSEGLVTDDGAAVVHRTSSQRPPSGITPDATTPSDQLQDGPGPIVFVPSLPAVRARSPRVRGRNATRAKYFRPAPAPGPRRGLVLGWGRSVLS